MHERHIKGLIDWPNELEARKMVVAITCGDRSALTNIYMGYYGCLAHFLSQFMGSDNRVEDVINDTFMTVWETARGFSFESKVSVWFFAHCTSPRIKVRAVSYTSRPDALRRGV